MRKSAASYGFLFGKPARMQGGQTLVVDEAYVRESIVNPAARVVAGYQPVMPTFRGTVSEEELLQLIAYIKSLKPPGAEAAPAAK